MTVSTLGEHALLARVLARLPRCPGSVLVGPGDDAAVMSTGRNQRLVVTTDAVVEEVHVSRRLSAPFDMGHRALAANLSDLAAMGAAPRWALLSLLLPDGWLVADVESLVDGVVALAQVFNVAIVGGNITRSPGPLVVDITAGGEAGPRKWLTRSGARPGDDLWLSGTVGAARAGLEILRALDDEQAMRDLVDTTVDRYRRPTPRVRLGLAMARGRAARAAVDLSDGLADAVRQLASASGCGAVIDGAAVPVDDAARRWWDERGVDPLTAALEGGDDYELLFAVPKRWGGRLRASLRRAQGPLTKIGVLTKHVGQTVVVRNGRTEDLPAGFEHFRRS